MASPEAQSHHESDIPGLFEPHYGLYPGISSFTREYDAADYREWVLRSNGDPVPAPLVLVVQDGSQARENPASENVTHPRTWRTAVAREIQLQGLLFDGDRPLEGVVCASTIAADWNDDALRDLSSSIQKAFPLVPAASEHWCACFGQARPSVERLQLLRGLGFSRIRLGIDLSLPQMSESAQSVEFERAETLLLEARSQGYRAFVTDLDLPVVVTDALADKIEKFLELTRVECVRFVVAVGPEVSPPESPLLAMRTGVLARLGYRHLGFDWYVTPADPSLGTGDPLYWSPLGYTNINGLDIIGVGPGAISVLEDACSQNIAQVESYQRMVAEGKIPTERGVELESDDLLRRTVMSGLLVNENFNIEALEEYWGILFSRYFEAEIPLLRELEQRGILMFTEREIRVLNRGRDALLALCRIFDNQDSVARISLLQEAR